MFKHGKLLIMALGLSINATGCDQSEGEPFDGSFRGGSTLGTGAGLTLNTNKWVSSAARDVYEFSRHDQWHHNSFGYEIKLESISLPSTPYGPVTTEVGPPPPPGEPYAEIAPGFGEFTVEVEGPDQGDPKHRQSGAALLGLELEFEVKGGGGEPHSVVLVVVAHHRDADAGDFYEFKKIDPETGAFLGPLCEEDAYGERFAKIYDGVSIDGETGAIEYVGQGLHHIACTSSAPGKATQFGYAPSLTPSQTFALANRVIRADYCGDGHPYTYPGNLLAIEDNVSAGQEGKTLADVQANLAPDEQLEAVWNPRGVMCVGTPRAGNVVREDIVCPIKHFANGTIAYNWRPPSCDAFVDDPPAGAVRFYSKTEL